MSRRPLVTAVLATAVLTMLSACTTTAGPSVSETTTQPAISSVQEPTMPNTARSTPMPSPAAQARLDQQLRDAAWADDVTLAADLIGRGADVNAKDDTVQSAYLIATSEGYLDLLRLTLAHGAKVDDKDSWNGTGLIRAAERGHGDVVGQLLQAGIDRDHVNRIGYQAIHEAVWLGEDIAEYATTVRVLVAGGVQIDRPSGNEGLTPSEMARERRFSGLESVLRAAQSAPPADPGTALLAAAEAGDANAAAVALRAGAKLEVRDDQQRTPLMRAVLGDHVAVAHLLVALGADPDALDYRKDTPWVMTGVTGSVAMLEALLPGQPDLKIPNRYGGTPVHPAAERGHVDYIRRVVELPIDLNKVNGSGWTALLEAVVLNDGGPAQQEIVKILLAHGADPAIRDAQGRTVLDNARRLGYREIVKILGG